MESICKIILFTGTRKATEEHKPFIWDCLATEGAKGTFLIHGGALGADDIAEDFCQRFGLKRSRIPYFSQFGNVGGAARNLAMIWHALGLKIPNPEAQIICLAFPLVGQRGGGTRNMMQQCRDFKIPVIDYPIKL